jgi:hypothetical protein
MYLCLFIFIIWIKSRMGTDGIDYDDYYEDN